jgi:hypothetical protein
MQGLPCVHYRPRTSASNEAPLDLLVPALMRLRNCTDSLKTLVLLDSLPEILLPALALAASHKTYIPAVAVKNDHQVLRASISRPRTWGDSRP